MLHMSCIPSRSMIEVGVTGGGSSFIPLGELVSHSDHVYLRCAQCPLRLNALALFSLSFLFFPAARSTSYSFHYPSLPRYGYSMWKENGSGHSDNFLPLRTPWSSGMDRATWLCYCSLHSNALNGPSTPLFSRCWGIVRLLKASQGS
jgi:hypothetical protein